MGKTCPHRRIYGGRRKPRAYPSLAGIAFAVAALAVATAFKAHDGSSRSFVGMWLSPGCDIKGNVSMETGERIYHVKGQKYYNATNIAAKYGERWFCSEQEARQAGWRKSRI